MLEKILTVENIPALIMMAGGSTYLFLALLIDPLIKHRITKKAAKAEAARRPNEVRDELTKPFWGDKLKNEKEPIK